METSSCWDVADTMDVSARTSFVESLGVLEAGADIGTGEMGFD